MQCVQVDTVGWAAVRFCRDSTNTAVASAGGAKSRRNHFVLLTIQTTRSLYVRVWPTSTLASVTMGALFLLPVGDKGTPVET